jgi:hypothetical protein
MPILAPVSTTNLGSMLLQNTFDDRIHLRPPFSPDLVVVAAEVGLARQGVYLYCLLLDRFSHSAAIPRLRIA